MNRISSKHPYATYGTRNSCLGLISSAYHNLHHKRSNQQPQNVETKLLPMSHQFLPHIRNAKSTSHGKNAQPHNVWHELVAHW